MTKKDLKDILGGNNNHKADRVGDFIVYSFAFFVGLIILAQIISFFR